MKKNNKYLINLILVILMSVALFGCKKSASGANEDNKASELIVVGFSQVGAESVWRNVNSESMKKTFTEKNGYKLIFEDGQQKQANQIMAIRKFIQQEVDYIVLAPVTETGWDTVLMEAKEAGIPVIIVDRMVDADPNLYTCWVGSNFKLEGEKLCTWIHEYCQSNGFDDTKLRIVDIQGNIGATAQIGRTRGLVDAAENYGWNVLRQTSGDFTRTKGYEVMKKILSQYKEINVVYCENDSMALGAIEAIEESGRNVGQNLAEGNIMVVSFDGVDEEARQCVIDGKITCIAECNPHHGPRVQSIIERLENGETLPKLSYVNEEMYAHDSTVSIVSIKGENYKVSVIDNATNEE